MLICKPTVLLSAAAGCCCMQSTSMCVMKKCSCKWIANNDVRHASTFGTGFSGSRGAIRTRSCTAAISTMSAADTWHGMLCNAPRWQKAGELTLQYQAASGIAAAPVVWVQVSSASQARPRSVPRKAPVNTSRWIKAYRAQPPHIFGNIRLHKPVNCLHWILVCI